MENRTKPTKVCYFGGSEEYGLRPIRAVMNGSMREMTPPIHSGVQGDTERIAPKKACAESAQILRKNQDKKPVVVLFSEISYFN